MGPPHLAAGSVHSLLCGSGGMHCGHEPLHNGELVVDDLGQGSQAVGGAGGIAEGKQSNHLSSAHHVIAALHSN